MKAMSRDRAQRRLSQFCSFHSICELFPGSSLRVWTHLNPFLYASFDWATQYYLFSFTHLALSVCNRKLCAADLQSTPGTVTSQLTSVAKYSLNRHKNRLQLGWETAQGESHVGWEWTSTGLKVFREKYFFFLIETFNLSCDKKRKGGCEASKHLR